MTISFHGLPEFEWPQVKIFIVTHQGPMSISLYQGSNSFQQFQKHCQCRLLVAKALFYSYYVHFPFLLLVVSQRDAFISLRFFRFAFSFIAQHRFQSCSVTLHSTPLHLCPFPLPPFQFMQRMPWELCRASTSSAESGKEYISSYTWSRSHHDKLWDKQCTRSLLEWCSRSHSSC
jgi:hypothetical protein